MNTIDIFRFAFFSVERARARTLLMLLATAIGVAAVVLLTGLGEAARRYITAEFASLGTNLVVVMPGKSETVGGTLQAGVGVITRDLTIDDAAALLRHHAVHRVVPLTVGAASIQHAGLEREATVFGATSDLLSLRQWDMWKGQFLPETKWTLANAVCVIGTEIESELFGNESALGRWVRVGESRFRVIGVLDPASKSIGMDVEELVIIPVASALSLFNSNSLFRILIEGKSPDNLDTIKAFTTKTIKERHHGEEDVTLVTEDAMLDTFDQIFTALTMAIAGIAAISLIVAGILIMNVMLVSVAQRTNEVGLLKAIGANPAQITHLFLTEALLLSVFGALVGIVIGLIGGFTITHFVPALDMRPPLWALVAGFTIAFVSGTLFGLMPARRAAALDPVLALAKK